ncbi:hypothetical protein TcBrA4_0042210 [Trypanosoma cruzi]|nr:hypothetical protein TcBrA4_0042210 [Trypanosoma cruzi]
MGCCSRFRLGNESTGRAPERGGCSRIVIFTGTPPSCSGAVLHVEVPENNSEPGSLVVQRRSANGLGLGSALRGGGAISVPSLTLVLAQVAGGGSGGIPGGSGTPGEIDFHSAWERVMPRTLDPCITTLARQLQCLPHTGQSAGVGSWRGGVQREEEAFPCEVLCVPTVRHPSCTDGMCLGRRAAGAVAAILICA